MIRRAALLAVVALGLSAAPALGIRIAVKGDWGAATTGQAAVSKRMCIRYDKAKFAFTLTTGDNFYPTGTATPESFAKPEKCLLDRGLKYRAAWGNHDVPGPSTGDLLRATSRWYTFVAGPARFVMLDANQPQNTNQLRWLNNVLSGEKVRPVIVAYHQGTRTAGLHEPITSQQRLWEPLFIKYKVKLVLQGHNHIYERIRYKGVTYITTGGGGANLYPCVRRQVGLVTCQSVHHFLLLEVTPTKVASRAIDTAGRVIDSVRFDLTP